MIVDEDAESAPVWVWLALIFIAGVSFWAQAVTTEERFVPALNVVANFYDMPNDVAGATLMAAGASSPELFSAIVSLFITHSSLGLGTVVGSEIFNQLCICAGAVFESRNGMLKLDKSIACREMFFYGLAIVLLYSSLNERHPLEGDDGGENHIFISFSDAALLVLGYVLYVIVLAKFNVILSWCGISANEEAGEELGHSKFLSYGSVDQNGDHADNSIGVTFVRQLSHEPRANFHSEESNLTTDISTRNVFNNSRSGELEEDTDLHGEEGPMVNSLMSLRENALDFFASRSTLRWGQFEVSDDIHKPSEIHGLHEICANEFDDSFSCFLWQHSEFYSRAKVAMNAWQLRWFTFGEDSVVSVPDRLEPKVTVSVYGKFKNIKVDKDHNVIRLTNSNSESARTDYILMAPSTKVLDAVVAKCKELVSYRESHEVADPYTEETEAEMEARLIDFPYGASNVGVFVHCVLFPIKMLMHYTIPDVRCDKEPSIRNAYLGVVLCLVWLIVASYFMVASLEQLASLMQIPDSIVGVTVSAAGTSLPNYVASQVAARQGLGNMAVSNAFGSNIFNIMIGLGLPWLFYTAFVTRGAKYHDLVDDGLQQSVIILAAVLLAFSVLVAWTGFVLYRWHGYAFLFLYSLYVIGEIVQCYV